MSILSRFGVIFRPFINKEGIHPIEKKVEEISAAKPLKNIEQLIHLWGW